MTRAAGRRAGPARRARSARRGGCQRLGSGGATEKGLGQEQKGAANQTAVGDVKHRPFDQVKIQEVADAVENDAIVEIAQRAGQDESQGGA